MMRRMRTLVGAVGLVVLSGCSGFRAVERGEWQHVWAEEASSHNQESPQAIISREKYEEELANSVRRNWEPAPGMAKPLLQETESIELKKGEVREFRLDEQAPVELQLQGSAVEVYWNPTAKRDEWKEGTDKVHRESTVLLQGKREGKGVLKLVSEETTRELPLTVKP
jgi:hypothetical protein